MSRPLLLLCLGALALLPLPSVAQAQAPTFEQFFDDSAVHELTLLVNSRDLRELRERYLEDTYYPADMVWDGLRVRNVAIRSRGSASRNPYKLGLKISFNKYVSGRTFAGMTALVLDNLWQDPAMLREKLAMALFTRMGQAAPREVLSRMYINGEFQGLYVVVEPVDARFLTRTLGDTNGYLFDYSLVDYFFYGQYLGPALGPYKERFEPDTHEKESDVTLFGPIRDAFFEVNHPVDSVWRERVGRYVDLEQFMSAVAIDTFLAEPDGLVGTSGMNNFYLYRPASSTRHSFLPWDKDQSFGVIDTPLTVRLESNELMRRAWLFDDLRALYFRTLGQSAVLAETNNWLAAELERLWALAAPAARTDPKKPFSNSQMEDGIQHLRDFIRSRPAFVRQELGLPTSEAPGASAATGRAAPKPVRATRTTP